MNTATGTDQLTIREARPEDARLLWEWANDPSVRSNSFNQEPIPWESHLRWYEKRLASPGTRFWLLEVNSVPAGQIRYDRDDEGHSAEISFSLAGEFRGKGLGTRIITLTLGPAVTELGVEEIVAVVLDGNIPSSKAFRSAGFGAPEVSSRNGIGCYRFIWRPAGKTEAQIAG
ncbi:MAG TPA: GNAT family N-acetyltransferase [Blastocatellia bacterium]|nr:GNAT family N-acetyltransferase [Blastocatellia bacterium]